MGKPKSPPPPLIEISQFPSKNKVKHKAPTHTKHPPKLLPGAPSFDFLPKIAQL